MIHPFRSLCPRRRAAFLACAALLPCGGVVAATTSGAVFSEVGNRGNPVSTRTAPVAGAGSYATGPLTGAGGDNTTRGQITVDYGVGGLPSLAASASGTTQASSLDAAFTSINVDLTYEFTVTGTAGTIVPVHFRGITDGTLATQGDPSRLYGEVGTRVRIVSQDIAGSFAAMGAQSGTAPDYYASNAGMVNLGWGAQAFGPVPYSDYASTWDWGADLVAGRVGTITLSTSLRGGTTGQLRGLAELTSSSAASFIDPYITIDPGWLADHPGFAISVEADIGNVGPTSAVPEPPALLLLVAGLGVLALRLQRRRADRRP